MRSYARRCFIIVIAFGFLGTVWLFSASTNHLEIQQIEKLPARVLLRSDRESKAIKAIRLLPNAVTLKRNLGVLGVPSVLATLQGFNAVDCKDFDDRALRLMISASRLEYLGLDGTMISDGSLAEIAKNFPSLTCLTIEECAVSEQAVIDLLSARQLLFLRVSDSFDRIEFRNRVREVAPNTIIMINGRDIMNQPEASFESIPWRIWE